RRLLTTALLLSLLLDPAILLLREHQDLPALDQNASLHVTFDPKTMTLRWDCRENVTSGECLMTTHKENSPGHLFLCCPFFLGLHLRGTWKFPG
uniref:IL-3 receptor alpha chain N-terminal domain-containing protein n=1 Tax=Sus scrofa TaxID=9823 RepID=A0A8W4FA70_PIG